MSENHNPELPRDPYGNPAPSSVPPGYDQPEPAAHEPPAQPSHEQPAPSSYAQAPTYGQALAYQPPAQQPYGQPGYPQQQGYQQPGYPQYGIVPGHEQKSRIVAGVLGLLLGSLGIHRFYLGHTKIGVIQLIVSFVTFGIGGIWGFIEGIMILVGADPFKTDADGVPLKD